MGFYPDVMIVKILMRIRTFTLTSLLLCENVLMWASEWSPFCTCSPGIKNYFERKLLRHASIECSANTTCIVYIYWMLAQKLQWADYYPVPVMIIIMNKNNERSHDCITFFVEFYSFLPENNNQKFMCDTRPKKIKQNKKKKHKADRKQVVSFRIVSFSHG